MAKKQIEKNPSHRETGELMINKDGTLNFHYFSKRSKIKESTYPNEIKVENIGTIDQEIEESELQKQAPKQEQLNFYYGQNQPRPGSPLRKTVTKEARTTHAGFGNIIGNFMREGNAQMLIQSKSPYKPKNQMETITVNSHSLPREESVQINVQSIPRDESLSRGYTSPKEEPSEYKQSYNSKSKYNVFKLIESYI